MSKLLTPSETAQRLGITEGTLRVWRCTKRYPLNYRKIGRSVMYAETDVEEFIEARKVAV